MHFACQRDGYIKICILRVFYSKALNNRNESHFIYSIKTFEICQLASEKLCLTRTSELFNKRKKLLVKNSVKFVKSKCP